MTELLVAINDAWRAACLHDGIAVDAAFVVFSDDNPFAARYDELMSLLEVPG